MEPQTRARTSNAHFWLNLMTILCILALYVFVRLEFVNDPSADEHVATAAVAQPGACEMRSSVDP